MEDPLEKEMTTHSSVLAWEIPWTEDPGGLQSMGSKRVRRDLLISTFSLTLPCVAVKKMRSRPLQNSNPSVCQIHINTNTNRNSDKGL